MTVTRGKDNIPSWDGNPSTWVEYRQAAFMYEETVKWESRYLCGPRLAAELTGAARVVLANKKRGWLSTQDGVAKLLRCLREAMSEPALPEIANQLRLYFKVLKRRRGEPMAAFCARHREEYAKACKALTRVMKERKSKSSSQPDEGMWRSSRRQSWNTTPSLRNPSARSSARGGTSDLASEGQHEDEEQNDQEEETGGRDTTTQWDGEGWSDGDWWWWYMGYYHQEEDGEELSEDDEEDYIEILPDPIKGWLLLEKSNIDHLERSLIQTEVKNDFSLASVEQALRSHFTDDQIRRRDGDAKHGAFYGEDEDDDEESWWQEEDESFFENMSEEAIALYQAAKSEEHEAWMQIQQGRQTLREARARQHEVKMGRKFYDYTGKKGDRGKGKHHNWSSGKGKGYNRDAGKGKYGPCARCGKGHDTQFCPGAKESENKTFEAEEQSEFIYGNFEEVSGEKAFCWTNLETNTWTTQQVVSEGYGVLDGGATKTMASVKALEHIQRHCREHQQPGITKVDVEDRPTFGFGNSEHNQCVSTCYLKLPVQEQDMSCKIHALDKGSAPVLISVSTLRRMGAIIDYNNDEAIFTAINPQKIVKLARSAAGHQLLPLTTDFMQEGSVCSKATTSLRQLILE